MAARIDNGLVQLLTRTGLEWTAKYPSVAAALANLNVKSANLDGELCGVDDAGLPSFALTQAAADGEHVRLVYYALGTLIVQMVTNPLTDPGHKGAGASARGPL
jgi:bifunctional non-homologous end joining protein LigD